MTERRVLITGGAGQIAGMLVGAGSRASWRYVLLDPVRPAGVEGRDDIEWRQASITDRAALHEAMAGVTDVIHLAAIGGEDEWSRIVEVNIEGTRHVLDAALKHGVGRFIFASSFHVAGFYTASEAPPGGLPDDAPPRPDTYYAWSKAAGESLLRLHCERSAMRGVAVRIGHCFAEPRAADRLGVWLSPRDARQLFHAALTADIPCFQHVWGVSDNARRWLARDGGLRLGYEPEDDSEPYATRLGATGHEPVDVPLGSGFTTVALGAPLRPRSA